ncbi:MAG: toxin-antitoxin system YwqK family antitoxin [Cyclobacteriaceae bacterium]|nr:toxin-antitoxin system YwqK family antitoxin [Cyclobacteriaceae bacterium]
MRVYVVVLFVSLISCSEKRGSASSSIELVGTPIGAEQKEFSDSPGLIKVTVNDNNGKVTASGLYLNKQREGSWVEYYPSGLTKSITSYVNGKKEGAALEFNDNGQLTKRSNYHLDQLDGEYREFNYTIVKEERFYKNGKLEGTVKIYYPDGKVMEEGLYKMGTRDGISKWYDQQGNVTIEYEYQNGVLIKK